MDGLPWINQTLRKLIRRRDRLYNNKKQKKSGDNRDIQKYKDVKRNVQRDLRRAYWNYKDGIVSPKDNGNHYSGLKRFWTYIKHKKTDSNGISPLRSDGLIHTNPTDRATILNKQFQSAFSEKTNITAPEFTDQCEINKK